MKVSKVLASSFKPSFKDKFRYDKELEGLRGVAAVGVMLWHGLGMGILDEKGLIPDFLTYFSIGPLAVYLFFVLSGYVMAYRYQNLSEFNVQKYLKARFVRLYPGYLLLFFFLFLIAFVPTFQFLTNLLMLQNDNYHIATFSVINELGPIWSIHYEVVFYLLFPLIIALNPRVFLLFLILLIFGTILYYNSYKLVSLSDYFFGFSFWLIGVIIAWKFKFVEKHEFNFLSYVFLVACYSHIAPGAIILKGLNIDSTFTKELGPHAIGLKTIIYIPICLLVIADLAKREIPLKKLLSLCTFLLPAAILLYLVLTKRLFSDIRWIMSSIFLLLSVFLFLEKKVSTPILRSLSFLGSLSYSIYLFHWPIALFINKYFPLRGTSTSFWVKFLIWISATFFVSYLVEKILQPRINQLFKKRVVVTEL